MFQLRRRTERPSGSLPKSGSVDDVKVPRILPAAVQSPGRLIIQFAGICANRLLRNDR